MITKHETKVSKDAGNKKINVKREFDAPVEQVWNAWTDRSLLDQWWAPKPWQAKTKKMDFKEGGSWLYAMIGPDGTEVWGRMDYKKITANKQFISDDLFCDENGKKKDDMPGMHWKANFSGTDSGTLAEIEITFDQKADMDKILEMGFESGFTAALGNLDELLEK